MTAGQTIMKAFFVAIIATVTYIFFLINWPDVARGFTAFTVFGLLLLIIFSPQYKITDGLRMIPLIHWLVLIAVPTLFILGSARFGIKLHVRVVIGICFLIFEIGMKVFSNRIFGRREM